jgi:hypothetical protein
MPTKEEMMKFAGEIEEIVATTDYNSLEAIVEYCNKTGLETEVAATLISPNLKAKIHEQAENMNMLKTKGSRLPI